MCHVDEALRLEDGSRQQDLWGINLFLHGTLPSAAKY